MGAPESPSPATSPGAPPAESSSALTKADLDELQQELKNGRHQQVLERSRTLLQGHPDHVVLLSIAASACYALRLYEEARGYLERALEIQPDSRVLGESLARVRARLDES